MLEEDIRPVAGDEWGIVSWLWQCFRHDLATVVSGLPYADGRYQTRGLPTEPSEDVAGYLARRPHPNTGEPAPVGFALVTGLVGERRSLTAMWVSPVMRGQGVGRRLALRAFGSHPGPWTVVFTESNVEAGKFWRAVADEAFGKRAWSEDVRPVPGVPEAFDHSIETR